MSRRVVCTGTRHVQRPDAAAGAHCGGGVSVKLLHWRNVGDELQISLMIISVLHKATGWDYSYLQQLCLQIRSPAPLAEHGVLPHCLVVKGVRSLQSTCRAIPVLEQSPVPQPSPPPPLAPFLPLLSAVAANVIVSTLS